MVRFCTPSSVLACIFNVRYYQSYINLIICDIKHKKIQKIDKNIDNPNELLYTISEVSKILKVNKNYVYALINDGHLKSIKLGCRKVTRKALLEFLDKYDGLDFDKALCVKTTK